MPKVLIDGNYVEVDLTNIFQDDGSTPFSALTVTPPGTTFTADDMARVRAEEKDKLYPLIESLKAQVSEFTGNLTAQQEAEKTRLQQEQAAAETAARSAEEADMDAKTLITRKEQEWQNQLNTMNTSWEQKFQKAETERLSAVALATKEREFSQIGEYARTAVETNRDNIAPQLLQFIKGDNKEQIDASIAMAIQTTNDILADIQQAGGQQKPGTQVVQQYTQQATPFSGTNTFGGPGNADPAGQQTQNYTPEQINAMSMPEYAEFRRKIGVGGQGGSKGLYG